MRVLVSAALGALALVAAAPMQAAVITLHSTIDLTAWNLSGTSFGMLGDAPDLGVVSKGDTVDLFIDFLGDQTLRIEGPTGLSGSTNVGRPDFYTSNATMTFINLTGPANVATSGGTSVPCCHLGANFPGASFVTGAGTIEFTGVRFTFANVDFTELSGGSSVSGGRLDGGGTRLSIGTFVQSSAPEPAAWALMIAGFGLAGATLRRRRSLTA